MNKIVTLEIIGKKSYSLFRKIPLVMRLSVVFFFLSLGIAVAGNTYAKCYAFAGYVEQYDRQCARSC